MASYFQTTIHSKNSKFEKTTGDGMGRLFKGTTSGGKRNISESRHIRHLNPMEDLPQKEQSIKEQIENKENGNRDKQSPNKKLTNYRSSKGTYAGQSQIFPAIFYKKTTMREVFKEFSFPEKCKALQPNDERCSLIFQIVGNLFGEITFYIFNLLIAQNSLSKTYFAFFSDSETIPFTKCCNTPAYVQLHPNGTGRILCNSKACQHPSLAQFLISYEDSSKLWKDMTYLQQASDIDKSMKAKISKYIKTGKYRKKNLQSVIDGTSREVSKIYFSSKGARKSNQSVQETPFLTDIPKNEDSQNLTDTDRQLMSFQQNEEGLLNEKDRASDLLKVKLAYITKKQKNFSRKIARGLIQQGKVFNKKFDMMDKLDQLIEQNTANKTFSKMTFPKLIEKLRVKQESKSRAKSRNKSFGY